MQPITITTNPSASSANNIAAAQTVASGANMVLTANAANIDSSGLSRFLLFTTTQNDSSVNALIKGLDSNGNSISETLALPSTSTASSVKAYASVSSINISAAVTANMTVGTTNATVSALSKIIPLNFYQRVPSMLAVEVTGTINYTIYETFDPILGVGTASAVMFPIGALTSKTANAISQTDQSVTGVQIQINSYSTGATLTMQIVSASNSNLG